MCIAILQKAGTELNNAQLKTGWDRNSDGGGVAYVNKAGHLIVQKGAMTYEAMAKIYEHALDHRHAESPMLVHMRIATSGLKSRNNTHPFEIRPQAGPRAAMIHNGILFTPSLKRGGREHDLKSDTRVVSEVLHNILRLQDVKDAKTDLGRAIGGGNKLAFLYENMEYVIINEDKGYWEKGIWYSNGSCRSWRM